MGRTVGWLVLCGLVIAAAGCATFRNGPEQVVEAFVTAYHQSWAVGDLGRTAALTTARGLEQSTAEMMRLTGTASQGIGPLSLVRLRSGREGDTETVVYRVVASRFSSYLGSGRTYDVEMRITLVSSSDPGDQRLDGAGRPLEPGRWYVDAVEDSRVQHVGAYPWLAWTPRELPPTHVKRPQDSR